MSFIFFLPCRPGPDLPGSTKTTLHLSKKSGNYAPKRYLGQGKLSKIDVCYATR
jgi:hypothetical protein